MKVLSYYRYVNADGSKKETDFREPRCQIDNEAQDVKDGMKSRLKMETGHAIWLDENRDDLHRTVPFWGRKNEEWTEYVSEGNADLRAEEMTRAVESFERVHGVIEVKEAEDRKETKINVAKREEFLRRIKMEERRIKANEEA